MKREQAIDRAMQAIYDCCPDRGSDAARIKAADIVAALEALGVVTLDSHIHLVPAVGAEVNLQGAVHAAYIKRETLIETVRMMGYTVATVGELRAAVAAAGFKLERITP